MEKPFDPRALLAEVFNYTRCERADGTFYGTGGVCRQGSQVGPREEIRRQGEVWTRIRGAEGAALSTEAKLELASSVTNVTVSAKEFDEIEKTLTAKEKEYTERFKRGEVTEEEMTDMIENFKFHGDAAQASMMIIGIEGTPPKVADGDMIDRHMGEQLARHFVKKEVAESGGDTNAVDLVLAPKTVETVMRFTKDTSEMMSIVSGNPVSPEKALYGTAVAARELRTLKANKEMYWPLGDRPGVKNSELAELIGSRAAYEQKFGSAMWKNLERDMKTFAQNNGQHALLVTSKNDPNAAVLRDSISKFVKDNGGTSSYFSYDTSKYKGTEGRATLEQFKNDRKGQIGAIHRVPKPGGRQTYIYEPGIGVSGQEINSRGPKGLASVLVRERQRMDAKGFTPRTKDQAEAIAQNRNFRRQVRTGKSVSQFSSKNNVQNLTDANVKASARLNNKAAQQELVRRGLAPRTAASKPSPAKKLGAASRSQTQAKAKTSQTSRQTQKLVEDRDKLRAKKKQILDRAKSRTSGKLTKKEAEDNNKLAAAIRKLDKKIDG